MQVKAPSYGQPTNRSQYSFRRSPVLGVLTVLLLAGGLLLATGVPAAAHDDLISSSPEAGSVVVGPEEITLTFSGELLAETSTAVIEVLAPDGQDIADGTPSIAGPTITQTLLPEQGSGVYAVRWRVVSSDGHPISNEYSFTVEGNTAPITTPSTEEPAEETPQPTPSSTETTEAAEYGGEPSGGGEFLPTLGIVMIAMILSGGVVGVLMAGRARRRRDKAIAQTAAAARENTDES